MTKDAKQRVIAASSISLLSVVAILAVAVVPVVLLGGFVYSTFSGIFVLVSPITAPVAVAIATGCVAIAAACVFMIWQIARDTEQPPTSHGGGSPDVT